MTVRSVTVNVDIDLSDFETEELIEEIRSRDENIFDDGCWGKLYVLLTNHKNDEALQLIRGMVQEKTGRIVP